MIFSSIDYILFFVIVLFFLHMIKNNYLKKSVLLLSSYFFYAYWDYRFIVLLLAMSVANYVFGNLIDECAVKNKRKALLVVSIVFNLTVLGFFKYFNFFVDSANVLLAQLNFRLPLINIILPVAISFITFEVMSYTIDIYRGNGYKAKSFIDLSLLVAFFPHLIAGPILKPRDFLPQFAKDIVIIKSNIISGLQIFVLGLVKKVLVADRLASYVDKVYDNPGLYNTPTLWLVVLAFSIQIYCDFSAYSDMAIGSAKCLGFSIPRNFNLPYISQNVTEFWRRWHISLSSWLRDYLYISMGGNRLGKKRLYSNLILTMLLGGLWHGASWNFVMWGGLHGIALIAHRLFKTSCSKLFSFHSGIKSVFNILSTFTFTSLLWVFFRSDSFDKTITIFKKLFCISDTGGVAWYATSIYFAAAFVIFNHLYGEKYDEYIQLNIERPIGIFVLIFVLIGILLLSPSEPAAFIYFQF